MHIKRIVIVITPKKLKNLDYLNFSTTAPNCKHGSH